MRHDLGISSIFKDDFTNYNGSDMLRRIFFDLGFSSLIKTFWVSVILIIPIFAYFDMIKNMRKIQKDTKNKCFVCNVDRDVFLKNKLSFEKHIKNEHNVLNYIYYILYVLTKPPQALTKMEKYVLDKFRINNLFWIPSQNTFVLENNEDNKIK
jgi:hypothetical protein